MFSFRFLKRTECLREGVDLTKNFATRFAIPVPIYLEQKVYLETQVFWYFWKPKFWIQIFIFVDSY